MNFKETMSMPAPKTPEEKSQMAIAQTERGIEYLNQHSPDINEEMRKLFEGMRGLGIPEDQISKALKSVDKDDARQAILELVENKVGAFFDGLESGESVD